MSDRVAVNVLYQHPKDAAAFEQYYRDVHIPLLQRHTSAVGINGVDLVKFEKNADGSAPSFYRMASLWFDSPAALDRGMATGEFKALVDDLKHFASGGVIAMISRKMGN
jgi:uncharacterized protein (TIGR02118 family)